MDATPHLSNHDEIGDSVLLLTSITALYQSLGAVRLLTLLPLFEPALSDVEAELARALDCLLELRRRISESTGR
jgi:hypothetical protein